MARPFNPNNYRGWRILVLRRDGNKCVICGSTERLEVDHILPFSRYPESRYDVDNGRVLCRECHKKTDSYGGKLLKGTRRDNDPYRTR